VHDAEDALQEASLRAWRGLARFEGRSSLRSWLYTIATNTCLNQIAKRPKRVLPIDYGPSSDPHDGPGEPLVESVWIEPYPDDQLGLEQRESVELAFVAAVQYLPATQRAVLILREVLGFSAQEVADSLETTVASVNSALQRARKAVDERVPEQSQQATLRALGDDGVRGIIEDYMDAMARGDVDKIVSMLAQDAAWSMPPLASWYRGEEIRDFLRLGPMSGDWNWRRLPAHANGQPAVAAYTWDDEDGCFRPFALDVLTLEGSKVKEVTAFITRAMERTDRDYYKRWPEQKQDPARLESVFARFGLPDRLD
jgi:RNA polymerase sigma-70 factor (ECF subfamily)